MAMRAQFAGQFCLEPEIFRATTTLASGSGFCIPKAILLAAVARAVGIPRP